MSTRPIIGVTSDVRIEKRTLSFAFSSYTLGVEQAGGIPIQIPPLSNLAAIPRILEEVQGVVIVGGEDLDPRLYGEEPAPTYRPLPPERARFDLELVRQLLDTSLPVLGICYGCQILAVVSGGSLYQDIATQVPGALTHTGTLPELPFHEIEIERGTRLFEILGARARVNSAHHQAPKELGAGIIATARAGDGVIEAIEARGDRFLIGVEWHPDLMPERPEGRRLFEALVEAARKGTTASGVDVHRHSR